MLASDGFADAYGAPRYLIGSCNKGPFADAEKWAAEAAGVILMAQIGADSTYEEGLANLFGMHLSSYSYSVPVLQQMRRSGARKIAVVTSTHSNFFVTTCAFGKEYAVGNVTVASTRQDEADLELVYDVSFDPKADDDGDGVANRVDVDFLDGVATGVCDSGADVFMACVQTDEAKVLVAKWQALEALRARYDNEAVDAAGLAAELADADGYAQLRANLARLEALETVFGPVGFDEMQRNAGRNPGAVQPLPAPAAAGSAARCPVGSTIHDPALVDGAGAASVASCTMCPAGYGIRGSTCQPCPSGSSSAAGSAVCDVRAHYYRWRDDAPELYRCPAHDDACRGQKAGGAGAGDALCASKATGPLCMLCEPKHHRVVSRRGRARCKRCDEWTGVADVYGYLVVFAGAALVAVISARRALAREIRTLTDQLRAKSRLHGFDRALPTLWTVARQAIYTITVMSQVRSIERLTLPKPYSNLIDVLTAFAIDVDKYLGPLACFEITYYDELLFWTLLPPAALAVAVLAAVAAGQMRGTARRMRGASIGDERALMLPDAPRVRRGDGRSPLRRVVVAWVIACIYLHSFICGVIYQVSVCARPHGNESKFLTHRGSRSFVRSDYGLACYTSTYRAYRLYAGLAFIAYATFPAVLALKLWVNRKSGRPERIWRS
ncbi:calcium ion binding protein [Aureococcus anophagefferens]|nr:calcium ion binding protein [Aureococcus anophagefferens]